MILLHIKSSVDFALDLYKFYISKILIVLLRT
jgi:hypothetical protein